MPATVTETLDLPGSGTPTVTVTIELVGAGGLPVEGFGSSTIVGRLNPTLTAGAWSETLVSNDDITPSGTVYKRTVQPARGQGWSDFFAVPTGGGTHQLLTLLTDPPGSLEPAALAALVERVAWLEAHALTDEEP